jgi:hypothetical protein
MQWLQNNRFPHENYTNTFVHSFRVYLYYSFSSFWYSLNRCDVKRESVERSGEERTRLIDWLYLTPTRLTFFCLQNAISLMHSSKGAPNFDPNGIVE